MAHEINRNELTGTDSFVSHKVRPWHGLGQIVENAMTAEEAIVLANLDYRVEKTSLHAEVKGEMFSLYPAFEDKFATYRTDNDTPLGIVGGRYEIVQNRDAFGFFDAIIDKGEAIFETAGALGKGERIFVSAKLPEDFTVNGDKCEKYIILTNSHDGTSSIIAGFTTVRVVCNNTLQAALSTLSNKVSIQHRSGAKEKLAEAHKVMGIASTYMKEVESVFTSMANRKITDDELNAYLTKVMKPEYNKKKTAEENQKVSTRVQNQVDFIIDLCKNDSTQLTEAAYGTYWGAYNGVSLAFNKAKFNTDADKANSMLFGYGASKINKAFKIANELVLS
jgi:phage/plasmid-like protein (TIGR03299 family)